MNMVNLTELRNNLGETLEYASLGEVVHVTKNGQVIACLVSEDLALWAESLERLWKGRIPPFSQEALDKWAAAVASKLTQRAP